LNQNGGRSTLIEVHKTFFIRALLKFRKRIIKNKGEKKNPIHLWNIFSCRSMLKRRVVITWSDIWRRFELLNILTKIHLHVYLCLILFLNFNKALIKNVLCTSISVDRPPFQNGGRSTLIEVHKTFFIRALLEFRKRIKHK
jgi:hypothetical protein